jgi:hypothetical protein
MAGNSLWSRHSRCPYMVTHVRAASRRERNDRSMNRSPAPPCLFQDDFGRRLRCSGPLTDGVEAPDSRQSSRVIDSGNDTGTSPGGRTRTQLESPPPSGGRRRDKRPSATATGCGSRHPAVRGGDGRDEPGPLCPRPGSTRQAEPNPIFLSRSQSGPRSCCGVRPDDHDRLPAFRFQSSFPRPSVPVPDPPTSRPSTLRLV